MRIQLSNNFQVVELIGDEINEESITKAVELVNKLGEAVQQPEKTKPSPVYHDVEGITDKQRAIFERYHIKCDGMTKEEARIKIKELFAK